jgi:PEP-CTERM motif
MKIASVLAMAALIFSSGAYAGLNGSTVNSTYYYNGGAYAFGNSATTFNAAGTSADLVFGSFNISVTDNQITYTFLKDSFFDYSAPSYTSNGIVINSGNLLSFTGADRITSVTYDSQSFQSTDLSFTFNDNQVGLNWENVSFTAGSKVILNLVTTPVPEPENLALLLAGLGLIAVRRRQL